MKLSKRQIGLVTDAVDDLFYKFKVRLLGRFFVGPKIYFEVVDDTDPLDTLEGIFVYTLKTLYGPQTAIDEDQIKLLSGIAGNYIEAERLRTTNKILADAAQAETIKEFESALKSNVKAATQKTSLLVNTETKAVQAYAERDGITQLASSLGVEDPTVAKLGILDDKTCKNCINLWHLESNHHIPRVYKLSELKEGYMTDHKNPYPTMGNTHPHCRHIMTFVPPNFGFDSGGNTR